jgi:hypothetical protein
MQQPPAAIIKANVTLKPVGYLIQRASQRTVVVASNVKNGHEILKALEGALTENCDPNHVIFYDTTSVDGELPAEPGVLLAWTDNMGLMSRLKPPNYSWLHSTLFVILCSTYPYFVQMPGPHCPAAVKASCRSSSREWRRAKMIRRCSHSSAR